MKKTVSVILSIIMIASLLSTAAFAQGLSNFQKTLTYTQGKFTDVSADDWFSLNVEAAYEYGLMNGRTSGSFNASDNVKISEVIVLAARLRSIYMTGSANFAVSTPWYQTYMDYAVSSGITTYNKYSDLNAYATRYQFAEILAASLPSSAFTSINNINYGDIPDVTLTGSYLSVYTLYKAGIITGKTTAGEFCPSDYILRSETAAIVTRIANEDLRIKFSIVKAGSNSAFTQLVTTITAAEDEIDLALESYNDAYSKATSGYYTGAAKLIDQANTYTQMAMMYLKSAADVCKGNSKYSSAYDGLYASYQKCQQIMSGVSTISSAGCSPSADWITPRTLLNDCASALIKANVIIGDIG